jgi:hypothetical protein
LSICEEDKIDGKLRQKFSSPTHLDVKVPCENCFGFWVLPDDGQQCWVVGWCKI